MVKAYSIRHCHARQKGEALASLEQTIAALGISLEIPEEGARAQHISGGTSWEAVVIHSPRSLSATIQVYAGPAPDLDIKWLEISEAPFRD